MPPRRSRTRTTQPPPTEIRAQRVPPANIAAPECADEQARFRLRQRIRTAALYEAIGDSRALGFGYDAYMPADSERPA